MLLRNKTAVLFGAGGSLCGAIARQFASEGARLFLSSRRLASAEKLAGEIRETGGSAEAAEVDATNPEAVAAWLDQVQGQSDHIDICFNGMGTDVVQNVPLIKMEVGDYFWPLQGMLRSQFITSTAAGRIMQAQGSGAILSLTATPGGIGYPFTGGFAAYCTALECLMQNLGAELGSYGVRTVNIRSGGSPDSRIFKEAIEQVPDVMEKVLGGMKQDTMLKRVPPMKDIAATAAFLASDGAASITGITIDVTAGTTAALNYRASNNSKNVPGGPSSA